MNFTLAWSPVSKISMAAFIVASLSCAGGGSNSQAPATPAPAITSFGAAKNPITQGMGTMLTAIFSNGTGVVNNSIGAVSSGNPISINPTADTTYTLTVTNTASVSVSQTATVAVVAPPTQPVISAPASTIEGAINLTATVPDQNGCTFAWSITGGSLTTGVDTRSIIFSAGPPGTIALTCVATNAAGTHSSAGLATISILAAPPVISFNPSSFAFRRSTTITPVVPVNTGGSPVLWSISPALPNGLSFNTSSGIISGIPQALSLPVIYTVTATNSGGSSTATLSIAVNDDPVSINYIPSVYVLTKGTPITTITPTSTGGAVSLWSISPSLPPGLSFSTSTGFLSGSPTAVTPTTVFTVTAEYVGGAATTNLVLTVNDAGTGISYAPVNNVWVRGLTISPLVPTVIGATPTSWVIEPALPAGLSFNSTTGIITGSPTVLSSLATYIVTATHSGGTYSTTLSITVKDSPPKISYTPSTYVFTKGSAVAPIAPANTGGAVVSWAIAPSPPSGLSFSTTNGQLTGTPSAITATTSYIVTATNSGGSGTASLSITVNDTPFHFTGFLASPPVVVFGGATTLSWTYSGTPIQLTLDGVTISGFSKNVSPVRRQSYTLFGKDAASTDQRVLMIPARGIDQLAGDPDGQGYRDGTGLQARFSSPYFLAIDPSGNAIVTDRGSLTIRKVTPGGMVTTIAGSPNFIGSADGNGSTAQFRGPQGVAVDSLGYMYIADTGNNTIRKISPIGEVTTLAGTAGLVGSTDGSGASARFNSPVGVAVDTSGTIYVVDASNFTIRKITPSGDVTTFVGSPGVQGSTDGLGPLASFSDPKGLALDASGNLYVADRGNHTIRKITPAGFVSTLAGVVHVSGANDGQGTNARFDHPWGVAVDALGNVYVADSDNLTIRKITPSGTVSTIAGLPHLPGSADGTGTLARFYSPRGVAVDASGVIFVADTLNDKIRMITPTAIVSTLAGKAKTIGYTDGTGPAAQFDTPYSGTVDSHRNVYVADMGNHTIRKITTSGAVTTVAGSGYAGYWDGIGTSARFSFPSVVAVDSADQIYIADDNTIRKMNTAGVVTTLAAGHSIDGMAVDSAGQIYFSENATIKKMSLGGVVTIVAGSEGQRGSTDGVGTTARFNYPVGLAFDSVGTLFVVDYYNHNIRKITPDNTVSTISGVAGVPGFIDGPAATARFSSPWGIAIDAYGNLYISEVANNTIRRINTSGVVSTIAGRLGTGAWSPGPLPGTLWRPINITISPDGDLILISNNGVIQITSP